jgi:outer membrane protein assembly factor BamB
VKLPETLRAGVYLTFVVASLVSACVNDEAGEIPARAGSTFKLDSRAGQPAVVNGILYLGTEAGLFYAVDVETGYELWRFEAGGPIFHPPVVHGELVIFGSWDGRLRAVNKSNGALIWEFEAGHVDWEVRDIFINGIPTVLNGVAYFSSEDFNVYAVELETGKELWRHSLGEEPQARYIPIVNRTAYIGAWDGHLYAIDIDTGNRVWRSATDNSGRASQANQVPFVTVVPIVAEDMVYFSDWAGNLFAVGRETGEQVWRFDSGAVDSRHVGSRSYIALEGNTLYYSTVEDRHMYGINRQTGREVWSIETDGIVYGPKPVGDGIAMYAEFMPDDSGDGGTMYRGAMDLNTRQVLWRVDDSESLMNVIDGIAYYVGIDGKVYGRDVHHGDEVFRMGE